jgi:hypothetical protein
MNPYQRGQGGPAGFHVRKPIRVRGQIFADQKAARAADQKRHSHNAFHVELRS